MVTDCRVLSGGLTGSASMRLCFLFPFTGKALSREDLLRLITWCVLVARLSCVNQICSVGTAYFIKGGLACVFIGVASVVDQCPLWMVLCESEQKRKQEDQSFKRWEAGRENVPPESVYILSLWTARAMMWCRPLVFSCSGCWIPTKRSTDRVRARGGGC